MKSELIVNLKTAKALGLADAALTAWTRQQGPTRTFGYVRFRAAVGGTTDIKT
jgi:hypothetical protein